MNDNDISLISAFKEANNFRDTYYVGISCSTCVNSLCVIFKHCIDSLRSIFRVCDLYKEDKE